LQLGAIEDFIDILRNHLNEFFACVAVAKTVIDDVGHDHLKEVPVLSAERNAGLKNAPPVWIIDLADQVERELLNMTVLRRCLFFKLDAKLPLD
jgi:hypothetical protein